MLTVTVENDTTDFFAVDCSIAVSVVAFDIILVGLTFLAFFAKLTPSAFYCWVPIYLLGIVTKTMKVLQVRTIYLVNWRLTMTRLAHRMMISHLKSKIRPKRKKKRKEYRIFISSFFVQNDRFDFVCLKVSSIELNKLANLFLNRHIYKHIR